MKILSVLTEGGKCHRVVFHYEKLLKLHLLNVLRDAIMMLYLKKLILVLLLYLPLSHLLFV